MKKNTFKPTDEQAAIVDRALTGDEFAVEAYAGAGKSSTFRLVSEAFPRQKIQYFAFNRAMADEAARRFPANVDCRTAHSLAYREEGHKIRHKLEGRLNGGLINREYDCGIFLGQLALGTVSTFTQSDADELTLRHVPKVMLDDAELRAQAANESFDKEAASDAALNLARRLWVRMVDSGDPLPSTHDAYLKLWALKGGSLRGGLILLDEAQDANPVMLQVFMRSRGQKLLVGDRFQQIYSWRGAVNAMEATGFDSMHLTQSFRFGENVAEQARRVILENLGERITLRGTPTVQSKVTPQVSSPDAIICRTNVQVFRQMMRHLEKGGRPFVQGGTRQTEILVKAVDQLLRRGGSNHPELVGFADAQSFRNFTEIAPEHELSQIYNLIDQFGARTLIEALGSCQQSSQYSDLVVTTAHKAKGLEWEKVRLADDFVQSGEQGFTREAGRLLYVAATRGSRAINELEHALDPVAKGRDYIKPSVAKTLF